jgi:hypothetical protein
MINYRTYILLFVSCGAAIAGPIVTFDLSGGAISGAPGDTIGWGFTVQSDPGMMTSFLSSFTLFETNPSIGSYTDFIGAQGGPVGFTLPAGAADWIEPFDPIQQTGAGSFTIDPGALIGAQDNGVIHIEYQLFPSTSSSLCDTFCSGSIELPFQVTVVAPVPEPATWGMGLMGLALLTIRECAKRGCLAKNSPRIETRDCVGASRFEARCAQRPLNPPHLGAPPVPIASIGSERYNMESKGFRAFRCPHALARRDGQARSERECTSGMLWPDDALSGS